MVIFLKQDDGREIAKMKLTTLEPFKARKIKENKLCNENLCNDKLFKQLIHLI